MIKKRKEKKNYIVLFRVDVYVYHKGWFLKIKKKKHIAAAFGGGKKKVRFLQVNVWLMFWLSFVQG